MSRQDCSRTAVDCGLPFGAGAVAAASVPLAVPLAAAVPLVLGLTCTSGLSPTIGGLSACANAAAEYSTATSARIILISVTLVGPHASRSSLVERSLPSSLRLDGRRPGPGQDHDG